MIRKARLSDVKTLDSFQHGIGVHERPLDSNIKRSGKIRYYTLKEFRDMIGSKKSLILIFEEDGEAIGCCAGKIVKQHADWSKHVYQGTIGLMYVKKGFRGKGAGKAMLSHLITWFKSNKIKDIRLQVYHNNHSAIGLYKKLGFKDHIHEMIFKP